MTFGEVIHYVSHSNGWPEQVRGLASLLIPLHSTGLGLDFQESPVSNPPESLDTPAAPAMLSYTTADFQQLIHSTATELKALAELPHYGGLRSTVPLWSQLLHALANTLSPDARILEDTPFIMPQAQDVISQPLNLVDGHATLIAAHVIHSTPNVHLVRSSTSSRKEQQEDELMHSANSSFSIHSDRSSTSSGSSAYEDETMYSADSDSHKGSVGSQDGLDLPLDAHMFPGRGKWHYAVLPVLLVADAHNIVPLLCSTLYQRRVWGILEPVVGLCCSNTGTTATAIFGWLDSDQSVEGHMPVAHLAFAAEDRLDPLIGMFDFTDSSSAISLAQFVLRLRSHFEDIKRIASIEAVNSLTPFRWRSDTSDFKTQMGVPLEDRVASWTNQVHVQTASSETSSSSGPRTPSPLSDPVVFLSSEKMSSQGLDIIHEVDVGRATHVLQATRATSETGTENRLRPPSSKAGSGSQRSSGSQRLKRGRKPSSRFSNSVFCAKNDDGLVDSPNISNWLFERSAFTVGRITIPSDSDVAKDSGINEMIEMYDQITAFTWSGAVRDELSNARIDNAVLGVRKKLFEAHASGNHQSAIKMPVKDVEFISARLSALLHAVQGASDCEGIANSHGANEAERRHEWDALLLKFFQPIIGKRDVLLERQLNFARNVAVDDDSFEAQARLRAQHYHDLCLAQHRIVSNTDDSNDVVDQASAAVRQAFQFSTDIRLRVLEKKLPEQLRDHSSKEPDKGICDAILVIPCSDAATATLQGAHGRKAQGDSLKASVLVHGKPDKQEVTGPARQSQAPSPHASQLEGELTQEQKAKLQNVYFVHPDRAGVTNGASEENTLSDASEQDLLLPVLLIEYKKKNESTIGKAMNQMKTYLVSSVHFLDALGITDQPVFGLVVNGRLGAVTMAWRRNKKIFIMERNVRYYDITDPLQAFQFVSVLLRLTQHGLKLRARFDENKGTFYDNLVKSRWSKFAQIEDSSSAVGTEEA